MSQKSEQAFNESWSLPEKFWLTDELLEKNNERQRVWREELNFVQCSPQQKARQRALTTRQSYERAGITHLLPAQLSELAAAYAELGRYDKAAELEPDVHQRVEYDSILLAVWRHDSDWCRHPEKHQYAERDIFSIKIDADAVLLRCNECGFRNVRSIPEHIAAGRSKRENARVLYGGRAPLEVLQECSR